MVANSRTRGYAAALFEVARGEGVLEEVEDELFRVARTIAGDDRLRQVLVDPGVPLQSRQQLVEDLLGNKGAHRVTTSLVSFMVGSGRARDLEGIVDEFLARAAIERQHEVAEVRSAVPLDASQRERLAEALSVATGKRIEVRVVVDPEVMGGLVARVGDRVIDGTIRNRLRQIRQHL